jgi:hypothetical protein
MPPIGFIRVQAVTSQAEVPVEGATVSVSGTNNAGGRELLSLQRTDESGLTDDVRIDTPALDNSLSPDMAKGWTDVTVTVTHPNFDGIIVNRVQVFPGVTTVQEAILIPRGALPSDLGETEVFNVPPQGL